MKDIVGPDAPTTTNGAGGKQSHVPVRFDLIDGRAMFEMAKVLHEGAEKYGADNWRLIGISDHLNHLLMHAYAYMSGDQSDDHLSHILCRATFAVGVQQAFLAQEETSKEEDAQIFQEVLKKEVCRHPEDCVELHYQFTEDKDRVFCWHCIQWLSQETVQARSDLMRKFKNVRW